ncbi:hypothetical protein DOK67_0000086 [Enterococcus sp. DIV0212c]|uniref:GntR family transcriptional regulator n=1 Tax=Enterococcus TaxID=1350 RepID=UPI003242467C
MKYDENRPIYQQIVEQIEYWIISGHFQTNEKIPSVRELAETLEVNPTTVQRAYSTLEKEGMLINQRGVGKFVTSEAEKIIELRFQLIEMYLETFISHLDKVDLTKEEKEHIIERIVREK